MAGIKHTTTLSDGDTLTDTMWNEEHAVTGDVNFGGYQITNVGDVDGVDISSIPEYFMTIPLVEGGTSEFSTTSSSWTDVESIGIRVDLSTYGSKAIFVALQRSSSSGKSCDCRLVRNGTEVASVYIGGLVNSYMMIRSSEFSIPSGTYTWKVQFATQAGYTNYLKRAFIVVTED